MKKFKRRNYMINKSVQPRYMAMTALFVCIVSVITGWTVYSTIWMTLTESISGEPELAVILAELNEILFYRILLVLLSGMCVAVVISMFISHRIAGPVYRICRTLGELGEGKIPHRINLRKRDEFKELSSSVNSVIDKAEGISARNRETVDNIKKLGNLPPGIEEELEKICYFESPGE